MMPRHVRRQRYGGAHQAMRRVYVAAYVPGTTPCGLCGLPMVGSAKLLDLAHNDAGTGYLGLAHRECNRGAAGRLSGATRRGKTYDPPGRPMTKW